MKYLKYVFFSIIAIVTLPLIVNAEDVNVIVKDNPSSTNVLCEITAEKGVSTVNDLKDLLHANCNIDVNEYMIAVRGYDEASGSEVVCNDFSCWGPTDNWQTTIFIYAKDHTRKEYTINSIPPKNENMAEDIFETNYELFDSYGFKSCNETFDVCSFIDYENAKVYDNVIINYNYNKTIALLAQTLINAGLMDKTEFDMTDTELLHYFNYGGSFINYATSFKNQLSNLNFSFDMDQRGGSDEPFETGAIGFYKFMYNDVLYGVKEFMSVTGKHIVYVPTDSSDKKQALEDRLKDLFGDNLKLTVTESDKTINECLNDFGLEPIEGGNEHYYILTVNDENNYRYLMQYNVIVKKDSSKINNNVSFKSNDLITGVVVATDENIPLDTLVKVVQLDSGETYEKILQTLNITEGEMFDISLKSISQNKQITKLDNGKFLVTIPIPEKYKDKTSFVVYYVDSNNNVIAYEAKADGKGNVTFETDHFSIYTLAITEKANEESKEEPVINNPGTLDSINFYGITLIISFIGIGLVIKRIKAN